MSRSNIAIFLSKIQTGYGRYVLRKICCHTVADGIFSRYQLSPLKTLFAGGMAGIANWLVCMPQDVLKSRVQTGRNAKIAKPTILR